MVNDAINYLVEFLKIIHGYTGNYGWAIIIFSAFIKLLLYAPTQAQYKSMKEMQKVQPELKALQEKLKDNPQKLQEEQMLLFKKYNINPLGGCFPLIIQMPILYGIFTAIRKMAEMGYFKGEVFLWIGGPLSKMYPDWIAPSLAHRDLPLLLLYGFSMYLSQKMSMTDTTGDKTQNMMGMMMPVVFTFILWNFPAALLLYWLMFNVFSIIQQSIVMKQGETTVSEPEIALTGPRIKTLEQINEKVSENEIDADGVNNSKSRSRKKKGGQ